MTNLPNHPDSLQKPPHRWLRGLFLLLVGLAVGAGAMHFFQRRTHNHGPTGGAACASVYMPACALFPAFLSPPTAMSHIKSGKLRAIGSASKQRLAIAPDVISLSEAGLPEFEVQAILGVVAPASMPDAIAERISADINQVAGRPDVQQAVLQTGLVVRPLPLKDFVNVVRQENELWSRVVKASGAKAD